MKQRKILLLLAAILILPNYAYGQGPGEMNVLFIAVDDLKPVMGCYGDTLVQTPNIDAIAGQGLTFTRNYCQQAVCAPSRASLMTSRYPDQTRVWDLETLMREMDPGIISLPQYMRQFGYITAATGKIFDPRSVDVGRDSPSWSIPWGKHWDQRYYSSKFGKPSYFYASQHAKDTIALLKAEALQQGVNQQTYVRERYFPAIESADVDVDAYVDGAIVNVGIELMEQVAASDKPFFLGIGFQRPHLPFNAPTQFWNLYQRSDFSLAAFREHAAGSPSLAYHSWNELRSYTGIPASGNLSNEVQLELIHAYYASISYIDHLVGLVITRLNELGLADNTAIVLWGDHGWHLGDHSLWCKHSNFEQATRSPLIISYPSQPNPGSRCGAVTEFTDIAPTLCDITGIDIPEFFEGESLTSLFEDTLSTVREAALSQYPRSGKMGYSLRTERYRYTLWVNRGDQSYYADELYDYLIDPLETVDYSSDPAYASTRAELDSMVRERISIPSTQERIRFRISGKSNEGDSTRIGGAEILLGHSSKTSNDKGELLLTHPAGEIEYQIIAPGYKPFTGIIALTQDTLLPIYLSEEYYDLDLTILASWSGESLPGASVEIMGREYMTDSAGKVLIPGLLYDRYSIKVMIPGIWSEMFTGIEISSDTSLVLSLSQPTFDVSIQCIDRYTSNGIIHSEISLGEMRKTTGSQGWVHFSVIEGNYELSIEHPAYANVKDSLRVQKDTIHSFHLDPSHSQVKFRLKEGETPVNLARVSFNDTAILSGSLGISRFEMIPTGSSYSYHVEKEGYYDVEGDLFLESDTTLNLQMDRLTGAGIDPSPPDLRIWPNPAGDFLFYDPGVRNEKGCLAIRDIFGRNLIRQPIPGSRNRISIKDLEPGTYIVVMETPRGRWVNILLKSQRI